MSGSYDCLIVSFLISTTITTRSSHFEKFNQRPDHDHNSVTCVQSYGYNFLVASHTHVHVYTRDYVVHMVYKISCSLQARNDLN